MKLENYNTVLDQLIKDGIQKSKTIIKCKDVSIVGIHLSPNEGYVAFAIHTEPSTINECCCIPDFTHNEILDIDIEDWYHEYWESEQKVEYGTESASGESGDSEYAELFVKWAATILESHAKEPSWPYTNAILCVHPVSSDPLKLWEV